MVIDTCKGRFSGTVAQCAEWLESYQPAVAHVLVRYNGAETSIIIDQDDEWTDGEELRSMLLAAWKEGRVDCGDALAAH